MKAWSKDVCSRSNISYFWQNSIWHGSVYGVNVYHWAPPCGEKKRHADIQHFMNIYGDQTVDVNVGKDGHFPSSDTITRAVKHWITSAGSDFLWAQHAGFFITGKKMHKQWWQLCWKKKVVLKLRICSISQHYCALYILYSFHGNKYEALLLEQFLMTRGSCNICHFFVNKDLKNSS